MPTWAAYDSDLGNAIEGVTYFWAKIEKVDYAQAFSLSEAVKQAHSAGSSVKSGIEKSNQTAAEMGEESAASIRELVTEVAAAIGLGGSSLVRRTLDVIGQEFVQDLIPFLGDIKNVVTGIKDMGSALIQRVKLWWDGRHVELRPGHPQSMAKGITTLVENSALDGLFKMAKGVVSATLTALTGGVAKIVNGIAGAVEWVVRKIYHLKEIKALNGLIEQCQQAWTTVLSNRSAIAAGADASGHGYEVDVFNDFFRQKINEAPVIAAITYRSGLAGDPMRLLEMLSADGSAINQSQFDAGVKYLNELKTTAGKYTDEWSKTLTSNDELVKNVLTALVAQQVTPGKAKSWVGKIKAKLSRSKA